MANKVSDFLTNFGPLAQDIAERTGIKPEVIMGQLANESDYGTNYKNNNPFNITDGRGHFLRFNSIPEGAQAYVKLMGTPRYSDVRNRPSIEGQADFISSRGYGGTPDYGRRVINAAGDVMKAGYNPSRTGSVDPNFDARSNEIFKNITGEDFPSSQEPKSNNVNISSNRESDRADEIFQQLTGKSLTDTLSDIDKAGNSDASSVKSPSTDISPQQVPDQTSPSQAQPANALQMSISKQNNGGIISDIGNAGNNLGAGIVRGVVDVGEGLGNLAAKGVTYMNDKFPILKSIDERYGTAPNPLQMSQRQADEERQYQQQYGDSGAALIGRIGGNMLGGYPITGPIGLAANSVKGSITALGVPYLSPALRGAVTVGDAATQGAAGAALMGGDIKEGAEAGAFVPVVGGALGGAAKLVGGAANLAGSFLQSPIGKVAGRLLAFHFGDLPGYILGGPVGDAIGYIGKKFGAPAAQKAADLIRNATSTAVDSGLPFVAGEAAGKGSNALETPQQ